MPSRHRILNQRDQQIGRVTFRKRSVERARQAHVGGAVMLVAERKASMHSTWVAGGTSFKQDGRVELDEDASRDSVSSSQRSTDVAKAAYLLNSHIEVSASRVFASAGYAHEAHDSMRKAFGSGRGRAERHRALQQGLEESAGRLLRIEHSVGILSSALHVCCTDGLPSGALQGERGQGSWGARGRREFRVVKNEWRQRPYIC